MVDLIVAPMPPSIKSYGYGFAVPTASLSVPHSAGDLMVGFAWGINMGDGTLGSPLITLGISSGYSTLALLNNVTTQPMLIGYKRASGGSVDNWNPSYACTGDDTQYAMGGLLVISDARTITTSSAYYTGSGSVTLPPYGTNSNLLIQAVFDLAYGLFSGGGTASPIINAPSSVFPVGSFYVPQAYTPKVVGNEFFYKYTGATGSTTYTGNGGAVPDNMYSIQVQIS